MIRRVVWFRSLKFVFPATIITASLLISSISFLFSEYAIKDEVSQTVKTNVRHRLNLLQGAIGLFEKLDRNDVYRQLLSSIISEADFIKLLIVQKDGRIISSNNSFDTGRLWTQVVHPVDEGKLEQALARRGTELTVDTEGELLEGYAPLCYSKKNIRARDCGFILYRIDLGYHFQKSLSNLRKELLLNAIGIMLLGIFLILIIHFKFTNRAQAMMMGMKVFAEGEHGHRVPMSGMDELSFLGRDINQLFEQVNSDRVKIRANEKKLDAIFNTVLEGIVTIDEQGIIQSCNASACKMFGYDADEMIGQNVNMLMPAEVSSEHDGYLKNYLETGLSKIIGKGRDVEARRKDGRTFQAELSIAETKINNARLFTGVLHDITERKHLEAALVKANELLFKSNLQLKDNARTDALTGLSNRRQFDYILHEEMNRAARQQLPVTLIMCDVDFFKLYNDSYGHQSGDDCLSRIGTVLRQSFKRSGELPARYGGEEFAVILPGVDTEAARFQAEQFLAAVRGLGIEHKASKLRLGIVTMSMGLATLVPQSADSDSKQLIKMADEALYTAKAQGRNSVAVYGGDTAASNNKG